MNSLTQRGFHGNYSSKNSSYRHYSFIRAITNHPMYDDGVCIGLLGNVRARHEQANNPNNFLRGNLFAASSEVTGQEK